MYPERWKSFARPEAATTNRPICLPHPGRVDMRANYNEVLNTLIDKIGMGKPGGFDPRHGFWGPSDTIDQFRKGLNKEGLFTWLGSRFDFGLEDRGVGWESPLLELVLRFEELLQRIERAPGHKVSVSPICFAADIQGPSEAVQRIANEMENDFLWIFLSKLKREVDSLGGMMTLTYRSGRKPWIAIRKDLEILSFFSIRLVPKGPNGETLDLLIEADREPWEFED